MTTKVRSDRLRLGVHDVLHYEGTIGETGHPGQVDHLAEGDHQLVVGDGPDLAVAADGHAHGLRPEVDLANLRDHHLNIRQKTPQRRHPARSLPSRVEIRPARPQK